MYGLSSQPQLHPYWCEQLWYQNVCRCECA